MYNFIISAINLCFVAVSSLQSAAMMEDSSPFSSPTADSSSSKGTRAQASSPITVQDALERMADICNARIFFHQTLFDFIKDDCPATPETKSLTYTFLHFGMVVDPKEISWVHYGNGSIKDTNDSLLKYQGILDKILEAKSHPEIRAIDEVYKIISYLFIRKQFSIEESRKCPQDKKSHTKSKSILERSIFEKETGDSHYFNIMLDFLRPFVTPIVV